MRSFSLPTQICLSWWVCISLPPTNSAQFIFPPSSHLLTGPMWADDMKYDPHHPKSGGGGGGHSPNTQKQTFTEEYNVWDRTHWTPIILALLWKSVLCQTNLYSFRIFYHPVLPKMRLRFVSFLSLSLPAFLSSSEHIFHHSSFLFRAFFFFSFRRTTNNAFPAYACRRSFEKHKIMEIELWEVASSSNSIFRHKCHVEKEEKG